MIIKTSLEKNRYLDDLRGIVLRLDRELEGNVLDFAKYVQLIYFLSEVVYTSDESLHSQPILQKKSTKAVLLAILKRTYKTGSIVVLQMTRVGPDG
jgi:hypothetical protein